MISQNVQQRSKRNLIPYVLGAIIVFAIAMVQGFALPAGTSKEMAEELRKTLEPIAALGPVALIFIIFINNAIKAFMAIVLGIFIGLPPLFFIGMNGFAIGMLVSVIGPATGWGMIVASLVPHGIIEIPLMLLATALGMTVGVESLKWIFKQRSEVRSSFRYGARIYLKWILAGLLIAALIEVFITPQIILMIGGTSLTQ